MALSGKRSERRSGRPTLDDVAKLAGVSRMVASRAVNGTGNVSPAASERVHEAIRMLGYVQHQGARSLATNRVDTVAFMAKLPNERFFADPNIARVVTGLKQVLSAEKRQLITLIVEDDGDAARAAQYVKKGFVDGVAVFSPSGLDDTIRDLTRSGIPVATNGLVPGAPGLDSVVVDIRNAARTVAEHLRSAGARELAVIAGMRHHAGTATVFDGIADVFGHIPPDRIRYGDHTANAGADGMRRLLEDSPDLDSVFVSSDVMAAAAIGVLQDSGRRVPDDVRVTGWDNSVHPAACHPSLTTLDIPFIEIGRTMATLISERVAGADGGRARLVDTTLIVRESA